MFADVAFSVILKITKTYKTLSAVNFSLNRFLSFCFASAFASFAFFVFCFTIFPFCLFLHHYRHCRRTQFKRFGIFAFSDNFT